MSIFVALTEEKISKLERELENANDLLAAARQRGMKSLKWSTILFFTNSMPCLGGIWTLGTLRGFFVLWLASG